LGECWEFKGSKPSGYGEFYLDKKKVRAHRYALELAAGPPPSAELCAMHRCDNRACCNPVHLKWGTITENTQDAAKKGLLERDDSLTVEEIWDIDYRFYKGTPAAQLSAEYGLKSNYIYKIIRRSVRVHVPMNPAVPEVFAGCWRRKRRMGRIADTAA
jgi:hypothetical protein